MLVAELVARVDQRRVRRGVERVQDPRELVALDVDVARDARPGPQRFGLQREFVARYAADLKRAERKRERLGPGVVGDLIVARHQQQHVEDRPRSPGA